MRVAAGAVPANKGAGTVSRPGMILPAFGQMRDSQPVSRKGKETKFLDGCNGQDCLAVAKRLRKLARDNVPGWVNQGNSSRKGRWKRRKLDRFQRPFRTHGFSDAIPGTLCRANFRCRSATIALLSIPFAPSKTPKSAFFKGFRVFDPISQVCDATSQVCEAAFPYCDVAPQFAERPRKLAMDRRKCWSSHRQLAPAPAVLRSSASNRHRRGANAIYPPANCMG